MANNEKAEIVGENKFLGCWYQNVSSFLLLSPIFMLIFQLFLGMLRFGFFESMIVGYLLIFSATVLLPAGIIFRCIGEPYFRIVDARWELRGSSPKKVFKKQIRAPYGLFILFEIVGGAVILLPMVLSYFERGFWRWDGFTFSLNLGLGLVLFGGMLLPLLYIYAKWLKNKAIQTAAWRYICYGCGYDLRGNLEAKNCPECGRLIERERLDDLKASGVMGDINI
ncbi:hypothetical protein JD969_01455 [Planctomycetota bacterium]|nr:hypothetical protein JD969_01455 [Planctomycetota bacterium]